MLVFQQLTAQDMKISNIRIKHISNDSILVTANYTYNGPYDSTMIIRAVAASANGFHHPQQTDFSMIPVTPGQREATMQIRFYRGAASFTSVRIDVCIFKVDRFVYCSDVPLQKVWGPPGGVQPDAGKAPAYKWCSIEGGISGELSVKADTDHDGNTETHVAKYVILREVNGSLIARSRITNRRYKFSNVRTGKHYELTVSGFSTIPRLPRIWCDGSKINYTVNMKVEFFYD